MNLRPHALGTLVLSLSLLACGTTRRDNDAEGHVGGAPSEVPGGASGAGGTPRAPEACGTMPAALVRLTRHERIQSVRSLLGDELADAMTLEIGGLRELAFPPLWSPQEGPYYTSTTFQESDQLAQLAGRYVREHFELTACAGDDFTCVRDYVAALGERAFRRPLGAEERAALLVPVVQAEALGVLAPVAAEYGVYAVFESPHFLYRSEFGAVAPGAAQGKLRLTDHELASFLAFFLTGAPPDSTLLEAANAGGLTNGKQLEAEVARLTATQASRDHFQALLAAQLRFVRLDSVVIDPAAAGISLTPGLREGMRTELEALLSTEAWSGSVGNLLTSRRARVNESLASLYGIQFPPAGASPDERGFVDLELPEDRAGLLTRAGWSTMTTRPDGPSVVGRGLAVMSLLCEPSPIFPELEPEVQQPLDLAERTEWQKAEYRMSQPRCSTCHSIIDPLGLAMEDVDMLGRFRTTDARGRPIQASVTLPPFAGGAKVNGVLELSQALPEELLARCLSDRLLTYALTTDSAAIRCARDTLAEARAQNGDQSLQKIIEQIALHTARLPRP